VVNAASDISVTWGLGINQGFSRRFYAYSVVMSKALTGEELDRHVIISM
jgi:hypothetical protein